MPNSRLPFENRWQKRTIEQRLAAELNLAQQDYRVAAVRLRELTAAIPCGVAAPDSEYQSFEVRAELERARATLQTALDRWKDFVTKGTVPEDLKEPSTE